MILLIIRFILLQCFISFVIGEEMSLDDETEVILQEATFGAGCFWCVEAIFERLDGVVDVSSGYSGGNSENPTYDEVCSGTTGHAEVIRILFNSEIITYEDLLKTFWLSHDPTTLNRQGADVGSQYRSVIFHHSDEQRLMAKKIKLDLEKNEIFKEPIVTEISPLINYYSAENYHQNYYRLNSTAPYCVAVIKPKLEKFFSK